MTFRLIGIPIIAVAGVYLYSGVRDRLVLPECDSSRAKRSLSEILDQLKLTPVRFEPIKTVSSNREQVVCNATLPLAEACELLGQPAHILAGLAERLRQRKSSYESVFRALVALAAMKPDSASVSAVLDEPDADPEDLVALDAAWEDEPVSFGPGAASSCKDSLIARSRSSRRPAPSIQG
jgi:hypothetical protein